MRRAGLATALLCLVLGAWGLYLTAQEGRWMVRPPSSAPTVVWGQRETAWRPYVEVDGPGQWSACVSSVSGRILPNYIMPDDTPQPALASNPPGVAGSL